jgi:nitrilase
MKIKVCLIQDSPVFFDKEKTIAKVEQLTKKHAKDGCKLIVFPESFIPGYPRGFPSLSDYLSRLKFNHYS